MIDRLECLTVKISSTATYSSQEQCHENFAVLGQFCA